MIQIIILKKKVNSESVIWQRPETEFWIKFLKNLIFDHFKKTNSIFAKKLLDNFEKEIINFFQVCPKEMLDKLDKPITINKTLDVAS